MKQVKKVEFEETTYLIELDGVEYEIPQRTAELEEKIREHDEKLPAMSEYDGNISMLEILFGKANVKKMFPEGKKVNLDKLAKVTKYSISLFMAEFNKIQAEEIQHSMQEIEPLLKQVTEAGKAVKTITSKSDMKKYVSKKK